MTTITKEFTKEQLIAKAQEQIAFCRDTKITGEGRTHVNQCSALFEIALASLTAKPIAHTSQYGIDRMIRDNAGLLVQAHGGNAYEIPLYTTPPAPIVPDAISTRQAISKMEECEPCDSINVAYKYGWNACRAAMLQANQRDLSQPVDPQVAEYEQIMLQAGNSPVTPDGWISCSERMPDDKQYVWFFGESRGFAGRDTFEGYYDWSRNKWWAVTDIGEEPASKVTHWMPLPEPPQQ
ncbi:TPA: DUF551 domain-containing protein [Salmonella enterica subsp. enterica serovar Orion]|nr:DUF551 domain-containing protein [Salmonella enterica subsp. enterica serovar Orion]EHK2731878.1 DUF551 domain-containing protein [Salmonella enterica]HEC7057350.1 DUF551 domain-containing protein [Salmonella enterica subsp. enterica serovar Orion]HEC8070926.1 DUF551 domain-containing protein [Salmonella enterica subsp. enterica serovar Orion]HEC9975017.1 DUF551 domain-containing protein [Salmonella enterica subsp. enterica serovar Orion]